jgi:hypothetical protein
MRAKSAVIPIVLYIVANVTALSPFVVVELIASGIAKSGKNAAQSQIAERSAYASETSSIRLRLKAIRMTL